MNNTQHTPSPWVFEKFRLDDIKTMEANCGVVSPGGVAICRCPRYEKRDQWEANARLIAAAPEMFNLLQSIASEDTQAFASCLELRLGRSVHGVDWMTEVRCLVKKLKGEPDEQPTT